MVLTTLIGRISDGLPLVASLEMGDQAGKYVTYQNQGKALFRKLSSHSPQVYTIETGPYYFHYLIENGVCFLVLCEKGYSKRLAFSYLEDLAQEFRAEYGKRVHAASRPYQFMEFDNYIQKTRKAFLDSRARSDLSTLNTELQDVQRIMMGNIDDVLQRGTALSELEGKAQNLSILSHKYKKQARYLNLRSTFAKFAVGLVVLLLFIAFIWLR